MNEQSTYLFCTEGSANKEYHAHLRAQGEGWVVQYANGPRGKVGQSKLKTPQPLPYEQALEAFDTLVKSKIKDGYTPDESGVRFTNTELAGRASGHVQQLPSAIDQEHAENLCRNPDWALQEKANGERRTVEITREGEVKGINKLGLYVNVPETWVTQFLAFGPATFDGEQVGDTFYVFDVLSVDGKDWRDRTFTERYAKLEQMTTERGSMAPSLRVLRAATTTEGKFAAVQGMREANLEGVVFKCLQSTYNGGRSSAAKKFKFLESSTCIVLKCNDKNSVLVGLLDTKGEVVETGNVTIPPNFPMPRKDDLVEVQYLYFNPGGAFEIPVYLGPRNDILREECTFKQVTRLKPDVDMDMDGRRVKLAIERPRG